MTSGEESEAAAGVLLLLLLLVVVVVVVCRISLGRKIQERDFGDLGENTRIIVSTIGILALVYVAVGERRFWGGWREGMG